MDGEIWFSTMRPCFRIKDRAVWVTQDWLSQRLSISLESEDLGRCSNASLGHLCLYHTVGQQLAICSLSLLTTQDLGQWTRQRSEVTGAKRHEASRPHAVPGEGWGVRVRFSTRNWMESGGKRCNTSFQFHPWFWSQTVLCPSVLFQPALSAL